jgi:hypothetical protein
MPSSKQSVQSQQTNIASGTAETTIVSADPNFRRNLTGLVITTLNAIAGTITLRDSTAGTIRAVFDYPNAAVVPSTPFLVEFDPPMLQSLPNNNWTLQASANANGYKITTAFVPE